MTGTGEVDHLVMTKSVIGCTGLLILKAPTEKLKETGTKMYIYPNYSDRQS